MNREEFYKYLRSKDASIFGSRLSQKQVDGMEALLNAGAGLPLHHMANILAQVWKETGGLMYPIKETVMPYHKDKNPSDAEVIRRLDKAFAEGKLPHVRAPYWRTGWFGRGQIQITHKYNYEKFGITDPAEALRPEISAKIAVVGMRDGMFTGKKLSDYNFPDALGELPHRHPRRIVNGIDGTDLDVSNAHRIFAVALRLSDWPEPPTRTATPAPQPMSPKPETLLSRLVSWVLSFFRKR